LVKHLRKVHIFSKEVHTGLGNPHNEAMTKVLPVKKLYPYVEDITSDYQCVSLERLVNCVPECDVDVNNNALIDCWAMMTSNLSTPTLI